MSSFDNANKEVKVLYDQLSPIVDDIVDKNSKEIDKIIKSIKSNLANLTNKEIHAYMLQLQIEAYEFARVKDMSILKQECATALLKEKQANVYSCTVGTQATKSNQAISETIDKQTVNILYNAVSNRLKTKLDETHRMINILSNVLISRNAEAKLHGGQKDDDLYNNSIWEINSN